MIITQANSPHLFTNIYIKMMFFDFFSVFDSVFLRTYDATDYVRGTQVHILPSNDSIRCNSILLSSSVLLLLLLLLMQWHLLWFVSFFFCWPKTILDFGLEFMAFLQFFGCSLCEMWRGERGAPLRRPRISSFLHHWFWCLNINHWRIAT